MQETHSDNTHLQQSDTSLSNEDAFHVRAKTLISKIFTDRIGNPYPLDASNREVFDQVAERIKNAGGTPYDATLIFMMIQLRILASVETNPRSAMWAKVTIQRCEELLPLCSLPEVSKEQLLETEMQFAIDEASGAIEPAKDRFDDWLMKFKSACARLHPQLVLDEDGASLVDSMKHELLKRAYERNADPKGVAKSFASSFEARNPSSSRD